MVADNRDMIYGYFPTEDEARNYITKIVSNNHHYNISDNYFVIRIDEITIVNTMGEENA